MRFTTLHAPCHLRGPEQGVCAASFLSLSPERAWHGRGSVDDLPPPPLPASLPRVLAALASPSFHHLNVKMLGVFGGTVAKLHGAQLSSQFGAALATGARYMSSGGDLKSLLASKIPAEQVGD